MKRYLFIIAIVSILVTYDSNIKNEHIKIVSTNIINEEEKDVQRAIEEDEKITFSNEYSTLVNKQNPLDEEYIPEDLVEIDVEFYNSNIERKHLRKQASEKLTLMFNDAKEEGINLVAISGYRSYISQSIIYNYNINTYGQEYTDKFVAKPGYSEHQTGLAIDVSSKSVGYDLIREFENTPEGMWLKSNCYKYGFIIRYPEGKENITGYEYESWHIRYVREDVANYIYENNITLEEYNDRL